MSRPIDHEIRAFLEQWKDLTAQTARQQLAKHDLAGSHRDAQHAPRVLWMLRRCEIPLHTPCLAMAREVARCGERDSSSPELVALCSDFVQQWQQLRGAVHRACVRMHLPEDYFPQITARLTPQQLRQTCVWPRVAAPVRTHARMWYMLVEVHRDAYVRHHPRATSSLVCGDLREWMGVHQARTAVGLLRDVADELTRVRGQFQQKRRQPHAMLSATLARAQQEEAERLQEELSDDGGARVAELEAWLHAQPGLECQTDPAQRLEYESATLVAARTAVRQWFHACIMLLMQRTCAAALRAVHVARRALACLPAAAAEHLAPALDRLDTRCSDIALYVDEGNDSVGGGEAHAAARRVIREAGTLDVLLAARLANQGQSSEPRFVPHACAQLLGPTDELKLPPEVEHLTVELQQATEGVVQLLDVHGAAPAPTPVFRSNPAGVGRELRVCSGEHEVVTILLDFALTCLTREIDREMFAEYPSAVAALDALRATAERLQTAPGTTHLTLEALNVHLDRAGACALLCG